MKVNWADCWFGPRNCRVLIHHLCKCLNDLSRNFYNLFMAQQLAALVIKIKSISGIFSFHFSFIELSAKQTHQYVQSRLGDKFHTFETLGNTSTKKKKCLFSCVCTMFTAGHSTAIYRFLVKSTCCCCQVRRKMYDWTLYLSSRLIWIYKFWIRFFLLSNPHTCSDIFVLHFAAIFPFESNNYTQSIFSKHGIRYFFFRSII